MDYIVGRGGLACEFETYFGPHKFIEIHGIDSDTYDCRVFNNRYEAYDDGEEYKPSPNDTFLFGTGSKKGKENLVFSIKSMVYSIRKTLPKPLLPLESYYLLILSLGTEM